jgi:hypothetical protein
MSPRRRLLAGVTVVVIVGAGVAFALLRNRPSPVRSAALGRLVAKEVTAPPNTRVRVEIITSSGRGSSGRR